MVIVFRNYALDKLVGGYLLVYTGVSTGIPFKMTKNGMKTNPSIYMHTEGTPKVPVPK